MSNTLLVLPPHATVESVTLAYSDSYWAYIEKQKQYFADIVWCLHGNDLLLGAERPIKERGYKVVMGAYPNDRNSLMRISALFSLFDVVTSPEPGSHVPYAGLFGARVSISGPRLPEQSINEKFVYAIYRNSVQAAELSLRWKQDWCQLSELSHLIKEPSDAETCISWAKKELGVENKLAPHELIRKFGWTKRQLMLRLTHRWVVSGTRKIRVFVNRSYSSCKLIRKYGLRIGIRNHIQLTKALKYHKGISTFTLQSGVQLRMRNGTSDPLNVLQHFATEELTSALPSKVENFIDVGAYCGYSANAVLEKFPNCKVLCVEPDRENFQILLANVHKDERITLVNAALWIHDQGVYLEDNEEGHWAKRVSAAAETGNPVPSISWTSLVKSYPPRPNTVLKLDVEGSEASILEHYWYEILSSVGMVILEIHEWIPGVAARVAVVLEKASSTFDLIFRKSGEFTIVTIKGLK